MKKLGLVLICAILLLSFLGCGTGIKLQVKSDENEEVVNNTEPSTETQTARATRLPAPTGTPTTVPTSVPTEKPTPTAIPTEKPTPTAIPTEVPTPTAPPATNDISVDNNFVRVSKYGASVLFPKGYSVAGETDTVYTLTATYNSMFYSMIITKAESEIVVKDYELMRTILNNELSSYTDNFDGSSEIETLSIDGHDAMMYDMSFDLSGIRNYYKCVVVFFQDKYYAFEIGTMFAKDNSGTIEQMVRSIRFEAVDPDPVQTSDANMATISKFGVSCLFPSNYTTDESGDQVTFSATPDGKPISLIISKMDATYIVKDYEFIRDALNEGIAGAGGEIISTSDIIEKKIDGYEAMMYDLVVKIYDIPFLYRIEVIFLNNNVVILMAGTLQSSGDSLVNTIIDSVKVVS